MPFKRTCISAAAYGVLLTTLQIAMVSATDVGTEEDTVEASLMSIVGAKIKPFY